MNWTKTCDAMPEDGRHIIGTVAYVHVEKGIQHHIDTVYRWQGNWYLVKDQLRVNYNVIAWMYFPEPYIPAEEAGE